MQVGTLWMSKGRENWKAFCILICKKQDPFIIQMFMNVNKKDIPT
jgi:hypothetical protein